jgi:hypothetical protein
VQLTTQAPPLASCATLCWTNSTDADTPLAPSVAVCVGTSHTACDVVPWTVPPAPPASSSSSSLPAPGAGPCPVLGNLVSPVFVPASSAPDTRCVRVNLTAVAEGPTAPKCPTLVGCVTVRDALSSSIVCGVPEELVTTTPEAPLNVTLTPIGASGNGSVVPVPATIEVAWNGGAQQSGCHAGAWLRYCVFARDGQGETVPLVPCTRAPALQGQATVELLHPYATHVEATVQIVSPNGAWCVVLLSV